MKKSNYRPDEADEIVLEFIFKKCPYELCEDELKCADCITDLVRTVIKNNRPHSRTK